MDTSGGTGGDGGTEAACKENYYQYPSQRKRRVLRTLGGVEVNLDGGVAARVEDLRDAMSNRRVDGQRKRTWRAWILVIDMVDGGKYGLANRLGSAFMPNPVSHATQLPNWDSSPVPIHTVRRRSAAH